MKRILGNLFAVAVIGIASVASANTITFDAQNLNNVNQLSTTGTLVEAAHFGATGTAWRSISANGISFAAASAGTEHLTVGSTGNGAAYADDNLYRPDTHVAGYQSITGLSADDANQLFDGCVYGPGAGNSLVTLNGLTANHKYQFQLLLVDDRAQTTVAVANEPAEATPIGPYDWSQNAAILVTGTFTAATTSQQFNCYSYYGADNNALLNAYQLRDVTIPEPNTVIIATTGIIALLAYAWRKRK